MRISEVFHRRVRGFRVVDLVGVGVLLVLVLGVYMAKAFAGRERAEIASVERQIEEERVQVRLLQAEVAHLEQPRRIESLAQAAQLAPIAADRETSEDALIDVARRPAKPSKSAAAPAPAPSEALAGADAPDGTADQPNEEAPR
ncbi:cell division protein [Caulobacter sp. D4A]|uniref:cell division protein FtsL n=1 Tax=unclassified Caulobacter TaxID=2648921 RepID=UPI000D73762A|nr:MULTISPECIES: cell division protein [unclassified Caulobacter]PXA78918.1 cell division protein [Caulobacter sp. D4A]PXA95946.1 cell division protein [Caulobacter sp. D5]